MKSNLIDVNQKNVAQLDRNNHLGTVGEFTASVIHEIRNSLTIERIVKAHGGKLLIQSNSITGTTVNVELPVAR